MNVVSLLSRAFRAWALFSQGLRPRDCWDGLGMSDRAGARPGARPYRWAVGLGEGASFGLGLGLSAGLGEGAGDASGASAGVEVEEGAGDVAFSGVGDGEAFEMISFRRFRIS